MPAEMGDSGPTADCSGEESRAAVAETAADPPRMTGAVMSVLLIGPMSRCSNCGRVPPEGQRWPHVTDGDWFCSLDCLYGLHPELAEGGV
jgi:hypothetical protein